MKIFIFIFMFLFVYRTAKASQPNDELLWMKNYANIRYVHISMKDA